MLQAQLGNSLWALKQRKALYAKLGQLPLDMKLGIIAKSAGSARWSISVSYANSRSFGPLDPFIDEFYVLSETGVSDIMCEIACVNHSFSWLSARTFPRTPLSQPSSMSFPRSGLAMRCGAGNRCACAGLRRIEPHRGDLIKTRGTVITRISPIIYANNQGFPRM